MAKRFDPLLPEAGGLARLREVRLAFYRRLETSGNERAPSTDNQTFLYPQDVERLSKILKLLADDEESRAMIMSYIAFAQMKNDVAGL